MMNELILRSKSLDRQIRSNVILREWLDPLRAPPLFWAVLGRHIILAAIVGLVAFWFDQQELLGYIDGQYLLTLMRSQAEFAAPGPWFSSNPLQGLGDIWYTTNTLWIPETRFGSLFSGVSWQRVATHWFAFVEIFLATALLSHWLRQSPSRSVAAGWLAVILITPLTYPSLLYSVPPDAPNIATSITFPFIVVVLWEGIGRGRLWSDLLRAFAIAALMWIHLIAVSVITTMAYPFIATVCMVQLVVAWNRRAEFWRKLVLGSTVVGLLLISGFPQILLGLVGDTAFQLFPQDLPTRIDRKLIEGSILFRPERFARLVAVLGVCGVSLHALFDTGRMKAFAVGVLLTIALIVALAIVYVFVALPGAPPIYYEFAAWPVYSIFAVSFLALLLRIASSNVATAWRDRLTPLRTWAWFVLPLLTVVVIHGGNRLSGAHNNMAITFPPTSTPIVDFLRPNLALSPGAPFRGRVTTLTGQGLPRAATWGQMFSLDINLIRTIGNDHRTIGLWYYNIPTLVEFSQTLTPLIYAVAKQYLAYPDDPQYRSILNMRRPDIHVMQLLGVRYVISDALAPAKGMLRRLTMPAGSGILAVDEVNTPNLGVSPVETSSLNMNRAALEWLGNPTNDFQRKALLAGANPGQLVKATDIDITVERGGLRVRASSQGRSLVVIPFQFSHCLRATRHNGSTPELRRVDLLLTGILFEGALDTTIEYQQGAFRGANCRLSDLADDRTFVNSH